MKLHPTSKMLVNRNCVLPLKESAVKVLNQLQSNLAIGSTNISLVCPENQKGTKENRKHKNTNGFVMDGKLIQKMIDYSPL